MAKYAVHWVNWCQKWVAVIKVNGKTLRFGYYDDPKIAAEVAAKARAKYMSFSAEAHIHHPCPNMR